MVAGVRLRQVEQTRRSGERPEVRRQLGEALRDRLRARLAQDPQAGARHGAQAILAVLGDEVVVAVAEEREVVMFEPRQQRLGLLDLAAVDRRRLLVELGDDPLHALAHPWPVLDRRVHLAQHAHEVAAQRVELVGLAVDLDVHDRLCQLVAPRRRDLDELVVVVAAHVDDRVDEQVDAVAVASELHAHRVHEERHASLTISTTVCADCQPCCSNCGRRAPSPRRGPGGA
jgi:hypothetical protein